MTEISRINVNADFSGGGDKGVEKALSDSKRLRDDAEKSKKLSEELRKAEAEAFADAVANNAEIVKSNQKVQKSTAQVSEQRKKEIELQEQLTALVKEHDRVSEERGRKSSIRSKKDLEAVNKEILLLTQIRAIQEELGIIDTKKQKRLEVLQKSFEGYIKKAQDAYKAEESTAAATKKAAEAIEIKTEKTKKATKETKSLTDTTEQLTLSLEENAKSIEKVDKAEETRSRNRQSRKQKEASDGGRRGGDNLPPAPPAGGGTPPGDDFDWEKYLQRIEERRRQITVEIQSAEGARLRALQRELRSLSDAEAFEEKRARVEYFRMEALERIKRLQEQITKETDGTSAAARRLRGEIDALEKRIADADTAISEGRGNADSLADALRRGALNADLLLARTQEENVRRGRAIELQRQALDGQYGALSAQIESLQKEKESLTLASAQKQIQNEINTLVRRRSALSLQLARTDEISTREIERSKAAIEELVSASERAVTSARDSEALYRTVLDLNRRRFEERIAGLRAQKELVSDPKAVQSLERQIDAAEEKLQAFLRDFESGRGSIESLARALEPVEYKIETTLEKTKEQNQEYERQRDLAERNTKGLREDIRSAQLILSNELARTKNLEARRILEKAIADIQEQDRKRQRDVRAGDFSEGQFARLLLSTQEAIVEGARARERAVKAERDYNIEVIKQRAVIRDIDALLKERAPLFKAGFSTNDIDKFEIALEKLRRELKDLSLSGRSVDDIGRRLRTFRSDIEASRVPLNRFEQAIERLRQRFTFLDRVFGKLDASSRGFSLFTTLATTAIEPLAAVVFQLAGGLTALAASALGAGAALGGALVAGAAQALPVLALLGAGFKSLIDVVQISNRQRQDQANNLARDARGVGGAAAQTDKLKTSQESLTEAQKRLNEARRQAIRDLQDLADKEKEAELAARSASISVAEAQIALQDAIKNGTALDIQRAQISLDSAKINERQAQRDNVRVGADADRTRANGVENNDQVISAKRALASAERQLADARRGGAGAASDLTQATARLDQQIKMLSPGQRELLDSINKLRAVFRSGPFVEIRDIILQPFTSAVKYLTDLGKDTNVVGSFIRLANAISDTLGRAVDKLFGPSSKDFIAFINGEAATNVNIIGTAFESLGSILGKIAESAAPVLRDVLQGISDTLGRIDNSLTESGLDSFFTSVQESLDAFGQVAEETFTLLKNLFEISSPTGNTLVSTFATFIRGINQQLADPRRRRELQTWFEEVGKGFAQVAGSLVDLARAIFTGLNTARLGEFASFISGVLAPAISGLVEVSGFFADVLSLLGKTKVADDFAALAIQVVILGKTFGTLLGIAGMVKTSFFALASGISEITKVSRTASGAQGLASLTTVLTYTNGKLKETQTGAVGAAGALGKLGGARGLIRGLGSALGAFGPYGLAAATALTLFGDQIVGLFPGLESLEDKTKKATKALLDLASVGNDKTNADLNLQRASISQREAVVARDEAFAARQAARRKLAKADTEKEKRAAEAELRAAQLALDSANLGVKEADQRLLEAGQQVEETSRKAKTSAAEAAKTLSSVFSSTEFKASGAAGPRGGVRITRRTKEERIKELQDLLGNDEDWKNLDTYTRGKVQGILETIVREKGSLPKDKLQIVLEAVANNKSITEVLKELDIKIPKGLNVNVLFDQKRIAAQAAAAGKTIDELLLERFRKLARIAGDPKLASAVARTDSERGRPLPFDMADGGVVRATPGGVRIRAGEDGHDEYVITTDPKKRDRSLSLIEQLTQRIRPQGTETYGVSEGDPPSLRGKGRGNPQPAAVASAPLSSFFTMFRRARALDLLDIPYSWGGGHTTPATPSSGIKSDGKDGSGIVGLDCSSSVSAVLQSAIPGFPTITSSEFPRQAGMSPGRGAVTVWSNDKHVFMSFGTEDWGTNSGEPGNGPGFHKHSKGGYTASHPSGLSRSSRDRSFYGSIFNVLFGSDLSKISSLDKELSGFGATARSFRPDYSGGVMSDAANNIAANILRGLQKFDVGGTVSGPDGAARVGILHAGEVVLDRKESRSIKNGDTAAEIMGAFKRAILKAIDSLGKAIPDGLKRILDFPEFKNRQGSIKNLFSMLGFVLDNNPKKRGNQTVAADNIVVGKKRFSIIDAVSQYLTGGYDPNADPDAKALLSTNLKKIKNKLAEAATRFAAFFDKLLSDISDRYTTQRESSQLSQTIASVARSGSFQSGVGFVFSGAGSWFQRFTSQSGQSAQDAQADIDALIGQRSSLVSERADLEAVISLSNASLAVLRPKADALRGLIADLTQKRQIIANKRITRTYTRQMKEAELAEVDRLIGAAQAELNSVNSQIQTAESAINRSTDRISQIGGEIATTDSQIAAAQGQKIDALIAQATSGRYTPAQAEEFLGQAEQLALATNDAVRLESIRKARFALGQSQLGAQIGLAQANLRLAERTGDEGLRRSSLEEIGRLLALQQTATQGEIDRLIAEGLDPNSQEIIALKIQLVELGIAIQDNTDALTGTTTQNFSSSAWQFFRRAIFGGESQLIAPFINPPISSPDVTIQPVQDTTGTNETLPGTNVTARGGDRSTSVTINVNEAPAGIDPTYLSSVLTFALEGKP